MLRWNNNDDDDDDDSSLEEEEEDSSTAFELSESRSIGLMQHT